MEPEDGFYFGDELIYCQACAHFVADWEELSTPRVRSDHGRCSIASLASDALVQARPGYRPAHIERRCLGFKPLPSDPNQHSGWERWPGLVYEYHVRVHGAPPAVSVVVAESPDPVEAFLRLWNA